jgi:signal transduction histidine kinase
MVANFTQAGTLVFIFINIIAMAINFRKTEAELTETKKQEQELANKNAVLESLSRVKSEYMENLSHETKTPLTIVSVNIQLAQELYQPMGEEGKIITKALARAHEEILRAARITENNLKLASMQASNEEMEVLDFAELLTRTVELQRLVIEKNGTKVEVNVPPILPPVFANADQLIQVVSNLLNNANRHTTNGKITVCAFHEEAYIITTVGDTGEGIPSEILPDIFKRGISGANSSGIGLPICQQIIEAHSGTISAESENGTVIQIKLPVYREDSNV